ECRTERGDSVRLRRETKTNHRLAARRNRRAIARRRLRSFARRVHGVRTTVHDILMERVLHVPRAVRRLEQEPVIRLVVREQQLGITFACQVIPSETLVLSEDLRGTVASW